MTSGRATSPVRPRTAARFADRVAIVTGAGSGMGRATALALGGCGARVAVADIDAEAAGATAAEITSRGGRAHAEGCDVSDSKQVDALVEGVEGAWGDLDFMFNVAGVHIAGDYHEFADADWRRLLDTNLWGVIHGTRAAYDAMRPRGRGHIVNMGSLSGLTPTPLQAPYAATKAAVIQLSVSLRSEAKRFGVRVSVVCPGAVETRLFANGAYLNGRDPDYLDRLSRFMYPADKAARKILSGVARNKAMIVFPGHAKFLYGLVRAHQGAIVPYAAFVRYAMGRNRQST